MKSVVRRITSNLLTIAACLVGIAAPVSAQGVHVEVTESTSQGRVFGWEHNLTDRDPNLSHWHWEPMDASARNRNVRRWTDPKSNSSEPQQIVRSHYIKPIHVALPGVNHGTAAGTNNTTADLNGKILRKNQGPAAIAQNKAVSTYENYSKGAATTQTYASAVKTQVAGNIVHMSGRRTSYNESPKTY